MLQNVEIGFFCKTNVLSEVVIGVVKISIHFMPSKKTFRPILTVFYYPDLGPWHINLSPCVKFQTCSFYLLVLDFVDLVTGEKVIQLLVLGLSLEFDKNHRLYMSSSKQD